MDHSLLGGLSPSSFLQRHWQKQPLLIRAAIPGFRDVLTLRSLIALSGHEACEARLVVADRGHYEVLHGPFSPRIFSELPENNWTLLVQGVNNVCRGTRALLHRFAFLPYARLDDVMVSYAAPGGGVGPHFDSYDVFLLQGHGRRMWQVGTQSDLELIPDADLRILKRFHPDGSCKVRCGDMLYLPPRFAHNGIAVDSCITYSIGFRAPDYEELKVQFLAYLDECLHLKGRYQDPQLTPTRHPAHLGDSMVSDVATAMGRIQWRRSDIVDFLGRHLSEPKPHIVLRPPPSISYRDFSKRAQREGIELHPALLLLFHGDHAFINGESHNMNRGARQAIILLANQRRLTPSQARRARGGLKTLHSWYGNGYISLGDWNQ